MRRGGLSESAFSRGPHSHHLRVPSLFGNVRIAYFCRSVLCASLSATSNASAAFAFTSGCRSPHTDLLSEVALGDISNEEKRGHYHRGTT
jgi:hypothetical protein